MFSSDTRFRKISRIMMIYSSYWLLEADCSRFTKKMTYWLLMSWSVFLVNSNWKRIFSEM